MTKRGEEWGGPPLSANECGGSPIAGQRQAWQGSTSSAVASKSTPALSVACGAEHLAALAVGQAPQRAAKSAHVTRARLELTHGAAAFTGASAGVRASALKPARPRPPTALAAAHLASLKMSAASASPPALAPGAGRRRKSCAAREGDASPAGKRARHFRPWRATPHHASEPAATASAAPAAHEHDRLPPSPPPTSGESRLSSPPPRCDLTPPTSSASPTPPPPPAKPDSPAHCSRLGAAQSPPPAALASLQDADSRHQSTPPTAPPILLRLPHTLTPPDGADGPSLRHSPPPLPPPPTLAPPPQLLLRVPPTHPYTALELRPAPPLPLPPLGAAPPPPQPRFAPPSPGPSAAAGRAPDPLQSEPLSLVLRHQAEPPRDSAPPPRDVPPPPPTLDPAPQSSQQQQQQQQAPRNYKNMTRERRIEANARERTRVHTISAAFDTLRRAVPSYAHAQKLSKLSVLRIASAYIMTLARVAGYDYSRDGSRPSLAECVDQVSRTIQTEGRLRRKKDD
ncbi:transcription factor ATOH8-like [Schistocerca piceifrons]|uniref:transcription factor ATOH8-like n=1 Tax=Schistocerca piceifrons TaxID=274613 RepID=UPI001F5F11E2|nr:transcription factor ATOH8-like [Schistocerca piceifrons]